MTDLVFIPQAECLRLKDSPEAFAAACRVNTLSMIAMAGSGHIGASFSSMEILVHLYLREMEPDDVLILSRGHEVPAWYAVQIGLGRLPEDMLYQLRRPGGLPGHPEVTTPGIAANTGSLGMGISKARGIVHADRLAGRKRRVFVLVGDGELDEGQNWEAIAACAAEGWSRLTVIIDNNGLQSDGPTRCGRAAKQDAKVRSGYYIERFALHPAPWDWTHGNGHLFGHLAEALEPSGTKGRPYVVVANTTKGKGVSFMEGNERWHSGAPNEAEYGLALTELMITLARTRYGAHPENVASGLRQLEQVAIQVPHVWPEPKTPDPLITAYSQALVELGERNDRVVVLDADLIKDCGLIPFRDRFPDRFIECGIAEQDMVSVASGLALQGYLPIVHSFAAFLTRRAFDQIHNQVSEGTKVVYVGTMAGRLHPNGPGRSHETTIDVDMMARLGVRTFVPWEADDVAEDLNTAVTGNGSAYLRLSTPTELERVS